MRSVLAGLDRGCFFLLGHFRTEQHTHLGNIRIAPRGRQQTMVTDAIEYATDRCPSALRDCWPNEPRTPPLPRARRRREGANAKIELHPVSHTNVSPALRQKCLFRVFAFRINLDVSLISHLVGYRTAISREGIRQSLPVPDFRRWASLAITGAYFYHPSVHARMVDVDTTFLHDFFQILLRNCISHIEEHRIQNYFFRVRAALEIDFHGGNTACSFSASITQYLVN